MKCLLTGIVFLLSSTLTFSLKEMTPARLQKINTDIEKRIPALKDSLSKVNMNADEIEFSVDTFKIEQMQVERLDIDLSTFGINAALEEKTASYDKLMNKYYNRLLKLLIAGDRKALVTTQKAWLGFRDVETTLIWTMTKDKYSGGGTMQTNIAMIAIGDLVVRRTIQLFGYYNEILSNK